MPSTSLTLQDLFDARNFEPNDNQKKAILHTDGPLYLPAGPGSGKTRVLLWRTVNLIVFHDVKPTEIFLSTFTEKAALQLREGLRQYLGAVSNQTGVQYDIGNMYVGTVHSLCQRIINDRRFYPNHQRPAPPSLMDELRQYFFLYNARRWSQLTAVAFDEDANEQITAYFGHASKSRHNAVVNCISLFNRFSEERLDPDRALTQTADPILQKLISMYREYLRLLQETNAVPLTDFSLLQKHAVALLEQHPQSAHVFKHIIIDEYQDTNTIQEQLFFRLAAGTKNLCVVGDDDQALYRFRGATVENFVQFPDRCKKIFGVAPTVHKLNINYRSRHRIVDFFTDFIPRADWQVPGTRKKFYRVADKEITADSQDFGPSVIASTPCKPEDACAEIAALVRELLATGRVSNANQIAFLYPSLKYDGKPTTQVARMKAALEAVGLQVYAPRAGRFLEVDEAIDVFGIFLHLFGKPDKGPFTSSGLNAFHDWLDLCLRRGKELLRADPQLAHYVADIKAESARSIADYAALSQTIVRKHWDLAAPYEPAIHKRILYDTPAISEHAKKVILSRHFDDFLRKHLDRGGTPFALSYILNRATSVDWNVLDLFYRICGFTHFRAMFDRAEQEGDEGPLSNLSLISNYLSQFNEQFGTIITGKRLSNDGMQRQFFTGYLYALWRLSEGEFEDADDPFPKGRIPFLTIHQSKGLEFPVVVLGNPRKQDRGPQKVETLVAPFVQRQGEPLELMSEFDIMRMFYVALSRAQNLLVIANFKGTGQRMNDPFNQMLDDHIPRIPAFKTKTVPIATVKDDDIPKNYSYTGDYLQYQKCARQYMVFRKFDFVPSRSQTMFFGSLVHRTLEDLHQYFIGQRSQP